MIVAGLCFSYFPLSQSVLGAPALNSGRFRSNSRAALTGFLGILRYSTSGSYGISRIVQRALGCSPRRRVVLTNAPLVSNTRVPFL